MDAKGDCHLLFVPVRESGSGMLAMRTGRLPSGQRVGLAFTSATSLLSELGPGQPWIRLHEDAMHDMLGPAGIDEIRVDACLSASRSAAGVLTLLILVPADHPDQQDVAYSRGKTAWGSLGSSAPGTDGRSVITGLFHVIEDLVSP